ncbi:hypothetical protein FD754_005894 [Muntiacus muntjak]|uniref:Uncharacterized protein n=1 Tax=Muntiacus muntjak TaxID=9888 RepID=A0A5N3WLL9_MUNMU|nr:hypothetical protein FD754_005894 [Muntiacus muntjak]
MQREEGFNTKMADGPDEYESEAGCVPLLHPEVLTGLLCRCAARRSGGHGGLVLVWNRTLSS